MSSYPLPPPPPPPPRRPPPPPPPPPQQSAASRYGSGSSGGYASSTSSYGSYGNNNNLGSPTSSTGSAAAPSPTGVGSYSSSSSFGSHHQLHHRAAAAPQPPPSAASYGGAMMLDKPPAASYTYGSGYGSSLGGPPVPQGYQQQQQPEEELYYRHSIVTLVFLLPCIWIILTTTSASTSFASESSLSTSTLWQIFCGTALFVYALDLANFREGCLYCIWLSVSFLTGLQAWTALGWQDGFRMLLWTATGFFLWTSLAARLTLAMEWLVNPNGPSLVLGQMEATLHALLPPLVAILTTERATEWMNDAWGTESAGLYAPYVFALVLTLAMLGVGSCAASFVRPEQQQDEQQHNGGDHGHNKHLYKPAIPGVVAFGHSCLLILTPAAMHLATCVSRITSPWVTMDDWYDLALVCTVPFLLHYVICLLHHADMIQSPYGHSRLFRKHSTLLPGLVGVLTMLVLQQRYLIAMSHALSYRFLGAKDPAWLSTLYWSAATFCMLVCFSLWGRKSSYNTGEPLLGEYHDDVVQLFLAGSGLFLGKAWGLPWNFTPLPVLACLGLTLWLATRMLRYLAIFLFVLHAAGLVIFTYRFAGMQHRLSLPLPGVPQLPLLHFGLMVCFTSVLVALVAGLSVRSAGGIGTKFVRRFDIPGLLLLLYSILLLILEITLVKRPIPTHELSGVERYEVDDLAAEETLYDHSTAILTSLILIFMAVVMVRVKLLSGRMAGLVICSAAAKALAFYIDAGLDDDDKPLPTVGTGRVGTLIANAHASASETGMDIFLRAVVAGILCVVLFSPRVLLNPVHVKALSHRRTRQATLSKTASSLPASAWRAVVLYAFCLLPLALLLSIPYVLYPLARVLVDQYYSNEDYVYVSSSPVLELAGTAISLWGVACMNMLNYYLPDGGAEALKKFSALVFLIGVTVFFCAPILGGVVVGGSAAYRQYSNNPYAAMSSLARHLHKSRASRSGGWGLLSAACATLLAISGPLELASRSSSSSSSGRHHDRLLLFRTMVFSLMFGSGVAWFVVMQSMSTAAPTAVLVICSVASLISAFMGTVAGVMGHFLDLEEFKEARQIASVWRFVTVFFIPLTWITTKINEQQQQDTTHLFASGGWLATYLFVCGLTALAVCLSIRSRKPHLQDYQTRNLANRMCITSWLLMVIILYGRYGVAGVDGNKAYHMQLVFGLPGCIAGTIAVSPILFLLQGEGSAASSKRGSVSKLSSQAAAARRHGGGGGSSSWFEFARLSPHNSWVPSFFGTFWVFVVASLYAILLRGSGLFFKVGLPEMLRKYGFGGPVDRFFQVVETLEAMGGVGLFTDEAAKLSIHAQHEILGAVASEMAQDGDLRDLATLAANAMAQDHALQASAKLAGAGFWTASDMMLPLLYLGGVAALLPSAYLLYRRVWLQKAVGSFTVILFLPLNAIPLVLCRAVMSLQAAAAMLVLAGILQIFVLRQADQDSKMRI